MHCLVAACKIALKLSARGFSILRFLGLALLATSSPQTTLQVKTDKYLGLARNSSYSSRLKIEVVCSKLPRPSGKFRLHLGCYVTIVGPHRGVEGSEQRLILSHVLALHCRQALQRGCCFMNGLRLLLQHLGVPNLQLLIPCYSEASRILISKPGSGTGRVLRKECIVNQNTTEAR